jgi:predicted dehydrogenase
VKWKDVGNSSEKMIMYKSLIVGCGKISGLYDKKDNDSIYSHAHAYANNKTIETVCFCDKNIDNAKKLAKKYNCENYSEDSLKSIEKFRPDVISVATPDTTHYDVVCEILSLPFEALPKVIILEKPACQNDIQLNDLIFKSEQKNVKILVNHSRRFDELHQNLKSAISEKRFGKLVKAHAVYYSGWDHNGIHTVDTLSFLFDDELEFLGLLNSEPSPYENDYNLEFKMKFKKSDVLIYLLTMNEDFYQLFEFDLMFENARIRIEDFGDRISYEEKIINIMNENVLIKKDFSVISNKEKTPMQSMIDLVVEHLNNQQNLDEYLIQNISKSMKVIWEGNKWTK